MRARTYFASQSPRRPPVSIRIAPRDRPVRRGYRTCQKFALRPRSQQEHCLRHPTASSPCKSGRHDLLQLTRRSRIHRCFKSAFKIATCNCNAFRYACQFMLSRASEKGRSRVMVLVLAGVCRAGEEDRLGGASAARFKRCARLRSMPRALAAASATSFCLRHSDAASTSRSNVPGRERSAWRCWRTTLSRSAGEPVTRRSDEISRSSSKSLPTCYCRSGWRRSGSKWAGRCGMAGHARPKGWD